jgi:hypothetical protein
MKIQLLYSNSAPGLHRSGVFMVCTMSLDTLPRIVAV